jgi:cytochrome c5
VVAGRGAVLGGMFGGNGAVARVPADRDVAAADEVAARAPVEPVLNQQVRRRCNACQDAQVRELPASWIAQNRAKISQLPHGMNRHD